MRLKIAVLARLNSGIRGGEAVPAPGLALQTPPTHLQPAGWAPPPAQAASPGSHRVRSAAETFTEQRALRVTRVAGATRTPVKLGHCADGGHGDWSHGRRECAGAGPGDASSVEIASHLHALPAFQPAAHPHRPPFPLQRAASASQGTQTTIAASAAASGPQATLTPPPPAACGRLLPATTSATLPLCSRPLAANMPLCPSVPLPLCSHVSGLYTRDRRSTSNSAARRPTRRSYSAWLLDARTHIGSAARSRARCAASAGDRRPTARWLAL